MSLVVRCQAGGEQRDLAMGEPVPIFLHEARGTGIRDFSENGSPNDDEFAGACCRSESLNGRRTCRSQDSGKCLGDVPGGTVA